MAVVTGGALAVGSIATIENRRVERECRAAQVAGRPFDPHCLDRTRGGHYGGGGSFGVFSDHGTSRSGSATSVSARGGFGGTGGHGGE